MRGEELFSVITVYGAPTIRAEDPAERRPPAQSSPICPSGWRRTITIPAWRQDASERLRHRALCNLPCQPQPDSHTLHHEGAACTRMVTHGVSNRVPAAF